MGGGVDMGLGWGVEGLPGIRRIVTYSPVSPGDPLLTHPQCLLLSHAFNQTSKYRHLCQTFAASDLDEFIRRESFLKLVKTFLHLILPIKDHYLAA